MLLLPRSPSPPGRLSCKGAGVGGTAWVQFLQWLTSAQRLSKSNPLRLTQQPRTRVPLPAGPLSCSCQPQHFALKSYADAGLRWPADKCSLLYRDVRGSALCLQPCPWGGSPLLPFLLFLWLFFRIIYWNSGTRSQPCEAVLPRGGHAVSAVINPARRKSEIQFCCRS